MTAAAMRFGLVGTGRIGQVHARNIAASPRAELAWIADPFVAGAEELATRYGARATADPGKVFSRDRVDAIIIASPTPTHVDMIRQAVEAGIPVLCEKPIDLDIARVEELRPLVASAGVPVAIGFNRRFDPHFAEVRSRIAAGEIGKLEQLTIFSRDPDAPPAGYIATSGGIFRDMTIHDFDMARFLVGDIVEVSAVGSTTFDSGAREHGDFDTTSTVLRGAEGAIVTIINSRHSPIGYDQRIEAFGPLGVLHVSNQSTGLVEHSHRGAVGSKAPNESFMFARYQPAYAAELEEFIALAKGEPSSSPTFDDGRAALLLADAAQRSADERTSVLVNLA